jgi:hypothetical protein
MAKKRQAFTKSGFLSVSKSGKLYRKKYSKKDAKLFAKLWFLGALILIISIFFSE